MTFVKRLHEQPLRQLPTSWQINEHFDERYDTFVGGERYEPITDSSSERLHMDGTGEFVLVPAEPSILDTHTGSFYSVQLAHGNPELSGALKRLKERIALYADYTRYSKVA